MINVFMTNPQGVTLEVSDRLTEVGSLHDTFEGDELTALVHSDIDFALDNQDGRITEFFEGADVGDEYTVEIWRDTGLRRPTMRLEFSGLLDLPWSIRYDDEGQSVTVQVFGQSKKLENADAENVKRTLTGRTASCPASTTVTPSSITDIAVGDEITLRDGTNEETRTVDTVGGVTFTVSEAYSNSYTDAEMIVETPYYRDTTVDTLVGLLFDEAGVDDYTINVNPVGSGPTGPPFGSRSTSDAADGWTQSNPNTHGDSDGTNTYTLVERLDTPIANTHQLWVQKNAVDLRKVDEFTDTIGAGYGSGDHDIAYDPRGDEIWVTFRRQEPGTEEILYLPSDGSSQTTVSTAAGSWGTLRWLDESKAGVMGKVPNGQDVLDRYELTSKTALGQITLPATVFPSSISVFDDRNRVAALYTIGGFSYIRVWTLPDWTLEGSYLVTETTAGAVTADEYDTGTERVYWGNIATTDYFIASRTFGGVIPYADFDGLSVGQALRELAVATGSFVTVDQHGVGLFTSRATVLRDRTYEIADAALDQRRMHITELYRDSVKIEGETLDEQEFSVVRGERSDPSRQLEISSPLIVEEPLAAAIGDVYLAFLAVARAEIEGTFVEPPEPYRPLDRIVLPDGRTYDVLSVVSDLVDKEQDLRLLEVV